MAKRVPGMVSVIIPCYNYARFLPQAVSSVCAQTYDLWEIIIVDDGSLDDTSVVARGLAGALPEKITALRQPNSGPAMARNSGVRIARGQYIVHLDADDMLVPTMLERCVEALEINPRAGFAYCGLQSFGDDWNTWPSVPFDAGLLAIDDYVPSQSMVRRTAWEAIDGFDTQSIPLGYEDWDFWMRLVAAGWVGAFVSEPLIYYRRHGNNMTHHFDPQQYWDARAQIICKHPKIYGPRLTAWAQQRQFLRGLLPLITPPLAEVPVELLEPGPPLQPPPFQPPQPVPQRVSLLWRLVRRVPFRLRVAVKALIHRFQLELRAAGLQS